MRYWHCFGLHGLVCSEFFLDTNDTMNWKKWLNHPEQRQHEHILNTGISLMVWTRLGSSFIYSYELCQEKERSGWWHVNKVNLVCAEKMRNVSFFNILVCLWLRYDYSLSIWLSVTVSVSSNVFDIILVSCWTFYRWQ